jgi:Ribonucleotide reductase, alpha subunit
MKNTHTQTEIEERYPETAASHDEDFYWLNEDSRAFLDDGYLLEGVTAEERVREIAENAASILDDDGFADKFYEYMSRGYYSLASPIWSNFGLDRGLPISCLVVTLKTLCQVFRLLVQRLK